MTTAASVDILVPAERADIAGVTSQSRIVFVKLVPDHHADDIQALYPGV